MRKRFSTALSFDSKEQKSSKTFNFKSTYKTVNIVYDVHARQKLIEGISKLAQTATKTLGPGGRNIALEYEGGDPKITKDGVTVVKSIHLGDRAQELGSKLLKK
jgi:chaperonin GroEL